jgi:hypothetical protein
METGKFFHRVYFFRWVSAKQDLRARQYLYLSGPFHKYGDVSRSSRRPARKARGGRIGSEIFNRRETPRAGMDRRPNAIVFMKRITKFIEVNLRSIQK